MPQSKRANLPNVKMEAWPLEDLWISDTFGSRAMRQFLACSAVSFDCRDFLENR